MEDQCLWTIRITGGDPFDFQAAGNPQVTHSGGTTAVNLVLAQSEIGRLKLEAAAAGCKVKAWPMAGQTEEQAAQRAAFMGLGTQERRWPTHLCETCAWFDPLGTGSPCGLQALPPESIEVLRSTSLAHQKSEEDCPIH